MPAPIRRWSVAVAATVLSLVASGCADDAAPLAQPSASTEFTAGDVPVVIPGSPGEPTQTVPPGGTGMMDNAGSWNEADVEFVTKMVPHHAQALEIAALAPDRASSPEVLALAERIESTQGPEIDVMQGWLEQQGLPPADPDNHGHAGMEGMVSGEQLFNLRAAEGGEFDRLFLEAMTRHHEGAITMAAGTVDAEHPIITDMVQDVVVGQSVEISRMEEVLADL